ncbi:MAG: RIP metalloprotease RseP [Paracoccaceae bacterium]
MDINSLVASFGNVGFVLVAFIIAISIIVAIHEYGHYIVGRWCGIHAEVFSLGFGPVLASRVDKHGTRWQVAAIPFGGYVKFMGDKDAASTGPDGEAMAGLSPAERRRTMHGAPLWARSLTVAAGPMANFILSAFIFSAFVFWQGVATERAVVGEVQNYPFDGPMLQTGDLITAIDGKPTPNLTQLYEVAGDLVPAPTVIYSVLRDGAAMDITAPPIFAPITSGIMPQSAAFDAGLKEGDVVQSVDGTMIHTFNQMRGIVGASDGRALDLVVWRNGETMNLTLTPRRSDVPKEGGGFETRWLMGLTNGALFQPEVRPAGLIEGVSYGAQQVWRMIADTFSGIAHIMRGDISTCNLKGPIGMAEITGAAATSGLANFIFTIGAISTAVGLMNLFPIPVLDGGHLVFHAWEAISRRPPPERVLQTLMMTGLVVILSFMAFALSRDLFC